MSHRVDKIRHKLKKYGAWEMGYLDELIDSQTRVIFNEVRNKSLEEQCKFLIEHGWDVNSIINHGKRIANLIHQHNNGIIPKKHRRK